MINKPLILVGGGNSIKQGTEQDLWNKIKGQEIWSLNFAFLTMPYTPSKEIWIDFFFFLAQQKNLLKLKDCELIAKNMGTVYKEFPVTTYEATSKYKDETLFLGRLCLCGVFAISLAIHRGYKNIYLLGFDHGTPIDKQKETHYYKGRVANPEVYRDSNGLVRDEVKDFEVFVRDDVKIHNVSTISNIKCFKKIDYPELFRRLN